MFGVNYEGDIPADFYPVIETYSYSVVRIEMVNPHASECAGVLVRRNGHTFIATARWPLAYSNGPIKIFTATDAQIPWMKIHYPGKGNLALIEVNDCDAIKDCPELPVVAKEFVDETTVITIYYEREDQSRNLRPIYQYGKVMPFRFTRENNHYQVVAIINNARLMVGTPIIDEYGFLVAILAGVYTAECEDPLFIAAPVTQLFNFMQRKCKR